MMILHWKHGLKGKREREGGGGEKIAAVFFLLYLAYSCNRMDTSAYSL